MKQYISDIITDYLSWRPGCAYFISAQTGTGKSTFVFEKLLKNAVRQNKYIIYLCNRKSLQNQMKKSLDPSRTLNVGYDISEKEQKHILFLTYQYCESSGQFPDFNVKVAPSKMNRSEKFKYSMSFGKFSLSITEDQVLYYVFDEAHYIVSDSTFNPDTNYWKWSKMIRNNSISVFITATPDPVFGYYLDHVMHSIHTSKSQLSLDAPKIPTSYLFPEPKYYMEEVLKEANKIDTSRRTTRNELNLPTNLETIRLAEKVFYFPQLVQSENVKLEFRKLKDINHQVNLCGYPFSLGLDFVEYSKRYFIENESIFPFGSKIYKFNNDYSYLNPIYFEDFGDLIDDIIASDKQWVIFVEKTKVGQNLADKLNEKNCKAVFISSSTRNQIKGGTKDTLLEIAECENFSCKVLITTSVLDCGINLKNSNLTNIVIEQSERTEFLQMIGRVRALENQKIDLYIKAFSLQRIQQLINQTENKLRFMSHMFGRKIVVEAMPADKRKFVSTLLYEYYYDERTKYKLSRTAYIYCLFSLYDYIEAKCTALENECLNMDFYIRQQLKWLGKEYDPNCWYKSQEKTNRLVDILEGAKLQGFLETDAQNKLCKQCIDIIIELPEVLLSPNMIRFKKEYIRMCNSTYYAKKKLSNQRSGKINIKKTSLEERILPKKEFLNRSFEYLKLPYEIESRQKTKNGERMTCWRINNRRDSQAST